MANSYSADVVVVGSGVAGALVAHQMALAGASVMMLEAGRRIPRWQIVENFRNSPVKSDFTTPYPSLPYAPHPEYSPANKYLIQKGDYPYNSQYLRLVGGTTWHWAAAAWRLLPSDFELHKRYGVGRDWPYAYEVLEPWYYAAEVQLGVSGPDSLIDLGSPRAQPYPMAALPLSYLDQRFTDVLQPHGFNVVPEPVARNSRPYDARPTCCGNNNCMPICPIGAMYNGVMHVEKAEQAGARLLTQAVVYRIEADSKGLINAVHFKDPSGNSTRVSGKMFVLAANGIETPKLMLISTSDAWPKGIGNRSDQVGRNLMDHPGTGVTFLAREALWPGRGPMEMTSIVNFRDGAFRSEYAAKKLHLSNAISTMAVSAELLRQGLSGAELERQIRERSARTLSINSFHEHLAEARNRIVPSTEHKDALGIPQPEIYYSINDYVKKSAANTRELYAQIAGLLGGTEVRFDDTFAPNNHIMGTTIMGHDPDDSVVDADCRTHDHANLFVAGSGVMPSAASVNCTLTIAALSLKLAAQLKREL
ncbi:GMC family oxidoreductase [Paraburkholderia bonniea]|uniref:GMC family oxidoreductase n=1 Tax=Paraburkholderia bonniea TaxID=2152891 RepID=UPI001290B91F|nr:GMC family oxidoreductase [Paraburkholderia bonniea]WJF91699.1 GMC family oxidoreductase [Paraburkholderia bonniea]WJF95019.1 GMC family oxidoreductase [Paraburkholderia bonniea]